MPRLTFRRACECGSDSIPQPQWRWIAVNGKEGHPISVSENIVSLEVETGLYCSKCKKPFVCLDEESNKVLVEMTIDRLRELIGEVVGNGVAPV